MDMIDIVETFTASKVVVETVDRNRPLWVKSEGEIKGRTKVTMEGVPRGLEVFVFNDFDLSERNRLIKNP